MTSPSPKLKSLARLHGIQTGYRDMGRERREASVESLLATLQALGSPIRGTADLDNSLVHRRRELWNRTIDPVVVAWDGNIPPIPIRGAESSRDDIVKYTLRTEDGRATEGQARLSRLPIRDRAEVDGTAYVLRELIVRRKLPSGYHLLELHSGAYSGQTLIVSSPRKAYFPLPGQEWGLFAPIYALHSRRHPGSGTLTEFGTLIDWMNTYGGKVAGTLPLLAAFLDQPFEPSPYAPASRLFWNEFYLDVNSGGRRSRQGHVDYKREYAARRAALEAQADEFFKGGRHPGRTDFDQFLKDNPLVDDYARFRAVTDQVGKGWQAWPARLRDGAIQRSDYSEQDRRYHAYAQWRMQRELGELSRKASHNGQVLYLDLPLGLHGDSYDVWRFRKIFVQQASGGAPPDLVFTQGQNWGFPPMHPEAMRLDHHRYTIRYIRNHLQFARLLRIDHVMGLHRLFWIPQGMSGDKGVYVEYPANELYAILCLESHRNRAGIVGENLGTVPPEVNSAMTRHNIQQMYVAQYEIVGNNSRNGMRKVPADTVASLNTHDMPTFRSFIESSDIDDRLDLGFLDEPAARKERRTRTVLRRSLTEFLNRQRLLAPEKRAHPKDLFLAATQFLAGSAARVTLINVEDIWHETHPQNVPATHQERPNWRRPMRLSIDEIQQAAEVADTLLAVDRRRRMRRESK